MTAISSIKTTDSSKQGIHKADIREERDAIPAQNLPAYKQLRFKIKLGRSPFKALLLEDIYFAVGDNPEEPYVPNYNNKRFSDR